MERVRVSRLGELPSDPDAAIAAAPYCWATSVAIGGAWTFGPRRDADAARALAARAALTGATWTPLLAARVDIAYDEGGGCEIPFEYLRRVPADLFRDVMREWVAAGYEIRLGFESEAGAVQSSGAWLQRAMAAKGPGVELAYYFRAGERDGQQTLWLERAGIDLANREARVWIAMRLRRQIDAARLVYGTGFAALVGVKSGALCTSGWRMTPATYPASGGPMFLLGGFYQPAELASYLADIFAVLGSRSVVVSETPVDFERGALWGGTPPSAVIGDASFVADAG